jgi:hypothetical protein
VVVVPVFSWHPHAACAALPELQASPQEEPRPRPLQQSSGERWAHDMTRRVTRMMVRPRMVQHQRVMELFEGTREAGRLRGP